MSEVKTVVSIEDEPEISELLGVVLESPLISLVRTHNGFDGLAKIRELHPDLVILDIMMPEMDGWSVYDAIRADDTIKDTPVIVLTVLHREFRRRRKFAESPIDAYITKPFDVRELRRKVEELVNQPIWSAPPDAEVAPGAVI